MIYRAIVNALIPPVDYPASLLINRSDWGQVLWAVRQGVPHFIRHAGTAKLLGVEPQDGFYTPLRLVRDEPEIAADLIGETGRRLDMKHRGQKTVLSRQ